VIPTFLCSLSALCRNLIAHGKAIHVTEADAAELELLAGLPWDQCSALRETETGWAHKLAELAGDEPTTNISSGGFERVVVTTADIAHGWLRLSKPYAEAMTDGGPYLVGAAELRRAAVCAELVLSASRPMYEPRPMAPIMVVTPEEAARFQEIIQKLGTAQLEVIPSGVHAHDGTKESARAAWGFVVGQLEANRPKLVIPLLKPGTPCPFPVLDRYRRELEALS